MYFLHHHHDVTSLDSSEVVLFFYRERLELEVMLRRGVKFEIEALSVQALSFLSTEYIPSKIQGGAYI